MTDEDHSSTTKSLPSPLYRLQERAIEVAEEILNDAPLSLKQDMVLEIFNRTGLTPPQQAPATTNNVPMEAFSTALQVLADSMGIRTNEPITVQGEIIEEIPTIKKAGRPKRKKLTARAAQATLEHISQPDADDA